MSDPKKNKESEGHYKSFVWLNNIESPDLLLEKRVEAPEFALPKYDVC